MNYLIQLTIGDWSDDGHGKTEIFLCKSNKDLAVVREAYKKGVEKIGLDLFKICDEYEHDAISFEEKSLFRCLDDDDEPGYFEGDFRLSTENMYHMWMEIVTAGDPDLEIEDYMLEVQYFNGYWSKDDDYNDQFGYGLFF